MASSQSSESNIAYIMNMPDNILISNLRKFSLLLALARITIDIDIFISLIALLLMILISLIFHFGHFPPYLFDLYLLKYLSI